MCLNTLPEEACYPRSPEVDQRDEVAALFHSKSRKLWKRTNMFWNVSLWEITIELLEYRWNYLKDDPMKEEYVEGTVRILGLGEWHGVGIRFKGSYSLYVCVAVWPSENDQTVDCAKLSLKLKFNFKDPSQTLFGLKRLNLHASLWDPTFMREKLAYGIWREMGVAAPRVSHAVVHVELARDQENVSTSKRLGVYNVVEQIDGRFTEAFFDGGDGNLYKEVWPGLSAHHYFYALRTNEKTANISRIVAFSEALAAADDDMKIANLVKAFTVVEHMAAYWAVDRAIEHWDGPSTFYKQVPGYFPHNFYLYESDPKVGNPTKFQMVPWDVGDALPDWDWKPKDFAWDTPVCKQDGCVACNARAAAIEYDAIVMPEQCFKFVRVFARGLRKEYMTAAARLLAGPLQLCRIKEKINRWAATLAPHIRDDVNAGLYPSLPSSVHPTVGSWERNLQTFIEKALPKHLAEFRSSVHCNRTYDQDLWDTGISEPLVVPYIPVWGPTGPWVRHRSPVRCDSDVFCDYEGCRVEGWDMFSCHEGTCYHGYKDARCAGKPREYVLNAHEWCWDGRVDSHCPAPPADEKSHMTIVLVGVVLGSIVIFSMAYCMWRKLKAFAFMLRPGSATRCAVKHESFEQRGCKEDDLSRAKDEIVKVASANCLCHQHGQLNAVSLGIESTSKVSETFAGPSDPTAACSLFGNVGSDGLVQMVPEHEGPVVQVRETPDVGAGLVIAL